jgi:hypothetical protein
MFFLSKDELSVLKDHMIPNCIKCNTKSVWIDHGFITGCGYYCRTCKEDVEHPDNIYGSIAQSKRTISKPIRTEFTKYKKWVDINCTKYQCINCNPLVNSLISPVNIKSGDHVKCINAKRANALTHHQIYYVESVEPFALKIRVFNISSKQIEILEYSRCRFQLEVDDDDVKVS